MNLIGFALYYVHPPAPPWCIAQYGHEAVPGTPGSVAGLIFSFNVRSFALFAAVLIFRMPWLYFAFEVVVLNIVLVYMMWRHEYICKSFVTQLKSNKD